ncbi:hypothetical protein HOY34_17895, partial [Xinfangfangia sp. D13-10-4-6]|uniref:hypothetical protein n=1 Tax=Pseudogemmobacter hezensis TaxID=2737662 RepID=UPI0015562B8A
PVVPAAPALDVTIDDVTTPVDPATPGNTTLTGTVTDPTGTGTVTVTVGGTDYPATINSDGTWTVDVPNASFDGNPVEATVTRGGETASDDTPVPVVPAAPALDVTIDDVTTPVDPATPGNTTLTGTVTDPTGTGTVTVTVGGTDYPATINSDGTWTVDVPNASFDGNPVEATVTRGGETASDDTTVPVTPHVSVDFVTDADGEVTGLVVAFDQAPFDSNGNPLTTPAQIAALLDLQGVTLGTGTSSNGGLIWTFPATPAQAAAGDDVAMSAEIADGTYQNAGAVAGVGESDTATAIAPNATVSIADDVLSATGPTTVTFTFDKEIDPSTFDPAADVTVLVGGQPAGTPGSFGTPSALVDNGDGTWSITVDYTPDASLRGETVSIELGNGSYTGVNGLSGSGAETGTAVPVNRPPSLVIEVDEDAVGYDAGPNLSGNTVGTYYDYGSQWTSSGGAISPTTYNGYLNMNADGGSHSATLNSTPNLNPGDALQIQMSWNNGWGAGNSGGASTLVWSYGGDVFATITTPEPGASGPSWGDPFPADSLYATITLAAGVEISMDGGQTWSSGPVDWKTWMEHTSQDNSWSAADADSLLFRFPDGQLDDAKQISFDWTAAGGTADDFQVVGLNVMSPQGGAGAPGAGDISYDPDAAGADPTAASLKPLATVTIQDPDDDLEVTGVTISIGGAGAQPEDLVWLAGMNAASGSLTLSGGEVTYSFADGTLTLTAEDFDVSDWNALLKGLNFGTTSDVAGLREISITVTDGIEDSNTESFSIDVKSGADSLPFDPNGLQPALAFAPQDAELFGFAAFEAAEDQDEDAADSDLPQLSQLFVQEDPALAFAGETADSRPDPVGTTDFEPVAFEPGRSALDDALESLSDY